MRISRKTLSFVALVVSMLYGVGFTVVDDKQTYAPIGGVIVAIAWIAVGVFGRDDRAIERRDSAIE
ncbi:hypothetical protein [Cumulibacter soli]|uniref:hypothetical protein n=1 Tax=Cumulibacter soli TaxID=2546344 RepID=UPI001ABAE922|nr:hypothetical protein [Cumulibacter soli]